MEAHRFFITWLLVVGLVEVYAQNYGRIVARSKYPKLNERASAPNPVNEDYLSEEDVISEFANEVRLHKRSNPSRMSKEDLDWHIKEGEKTLKRLSEQTAENKAHREWVQGQLQAQQRNVQTAANDKKKNQWEQNRPGPSHRT